MAKKPSVEISRMSLYQNLKIKLKINNYYIPVGATTRTGHMMTSPKFSTWRPNQGTRSRVTFQLFATSRSDLFPQYLRSCAFVWQGSTWVWKKMASDEVCVFSRGKTAEKGSVSAQRSTWQSAKYLKIERCVSIFWSLKKQLWNLHKICLLMVVLLSQSKAFWHSAVCLNLQ